MNQLVQLGLLAVAGQLATTLLAVFFLGIGLPIFAMLGVLNALVVLNVISLLVMRRARPISNAQLFLPCCSM